MDKIIKTIKAFFWILTLKRDDAYSGGSVHIAYLHTAVKGLIWLWVCFFGAMFLRIIITIVGLF